MANKYEAMDLLGRPPESKQEHLVMAYFDAYQDRALTESETAAYQRHLASCKTCQARVDAHYLVAQDLRNEVPPPVALSPAAAARIQQNIAGRMRRALIVNNVRAAFGATMAIAVLALVVTLFVIQSRNLETLEKTGTFTPASVAALEPTEEGLIEAVRAKDIATVEWILEAGISPNIVDYDGEPILKAAIRRRSPKIVALLVGYGADVNVLDSSGNSLLPQAVRIGNLEMVQTLVEAGADLKGTLIATATGAGTVKLAALNWAASDNRVEIARYLIEQGADLDEGDSQYERTPLHGAAFNNNSEMITLLLDSGADPNALSTFSSDGRPLHFAIVGGSVGAVQALLDGGADVDIQSETDQKTPLMFVQLEGMSGVRGQITTLLLEAGADPNLQNNVGNTALHLAARLGRIDSIPILVEHGASLEVENMRGETPLDVAADDRIIELLTELRAGQ